MEKRSRICSLVLVVFFLVLTAAAAAVAGTAVLSQETKQCLSCHGKHGLLLKFQNNEFVEAYVDVEKMNDSVHRSLPCSSCHPLFENGKHPQRRFRDKLQYQTRTAQACRHCHSVQQIKKSICHDILLNRESKGTPIICTNCHGSHAIRTTAGSAAYSSEEAYCMNCHGFPAVMSFRNGESLSVTVNRSTLQSSVHDKLLCSDCHYGFSSEEHPKRNFSTRRDYTLALSENCRRCHFDKYTKTMESIHYRMLSQGNLTAPVCIDCHGAHGISHVGKERALVAKRCQRCHADIYDMYAKSVHGSALFNENNQDVPVCADCHTAHTIEDPRTMNYRERIPEICSNCHANKAIVGKYGLSTGVVDSYLSDFHGVTLRFYKMQNQEQRRPSKPMAVCTDCHGSHNITSTIGPDSPAVKANLINRCRKCHSDATANFPDSWLSHYEPSLSRAPLVFFLNLIYKIFIPVLLIGLVLQILLHIWRFVVNR